MEAEPCSHCNRSAEWLICTGDMDMLGTPVCTDHVSRVLRQEVSCNYVWPFREWLDGGEHLLGAKARARCGSQ